MFVVIVDKSTISCYYLYEVISVEKTIGEMIKKARESANSNGKKLTQDELGEKIGMSGQTISLYENGSREVPIKQLKKIAKVTGKPISWFFGEEAANPEISTVKDVIETVERLENTFRSYSEVNPVSYYHADESNTRLELTFSIPFTYKKIFDQIKTIRDLSVNMPDEARNAWYKVLMEEQSKVSVNDMLTEEKR